MTVRKFTLLPLAGLALMMLQAGTVTEALAAACPAVTVANDMGIKGKYPQQFELAEFEKAAGCKLTFSENTAAHLTCCRTRRKQAHQTSCQCAT